MGQRLHDKVLQLLGHQRKYVTRAVYTVLNALFIALQVVGAQQYLQIIPSETLPRGIRWQGRHSDTAATAAEVVRLAESLQEEAYLEASVDSIQKRDSLWKVWLHVGPAYRWAGLMSGAVPSAALREAGFREAKWEGSLVRRSSLDRLLQQLLDYATNNGYPFAQTGLKDKTFTAGRLQAALVWDPGPLVTLDTLVQIGETPVKNSFLRQYLGLRTGNLYRQDQVVRLRERLRALPYLQLRKDPEIRFLGDKAEAVLDLTSKNASRFDFLVGVLPNNVQLNRLLLTGTIEADLWNSLGAGERIYARFEQLRPQTQRLDLQGNYPYPAGLPIGLDTRFHFYKRDTTFLDAEADIGLQALVEGSDYIKAFWVQRGSRLLGFNGSALLKENKLPTNLDMRTRFFGFEFSRQRLDYRFNPRSGWASRLAISAGTKEVVRNGRIQDLGLGALYDSMVLRSAQYRAELRAEIFRPVLRRAAFRYAFHGRWLLSREPVQRNEQYRIGGNRLLRGFDEEFFQVTHFAVNTFEYRLLLGENSNLFGFLDAAWAEDSSTEGVNVFYPYGLGAGISFETQAGIFGFSVAFGARWGDPLNLNSPKVHLGYVGLF